MFSKVRNILLISLLSLTSMQVFSATEDTTSAIPQIPEATIKSYSKDFSVSESEALRRLKIMQMSSMISQKLVDKFGADLIAGVFFEHGKDFKINVRTTKQGQKSRDVLNFTTQEMPDLNINIIPNSPRNYHAIENIILNQTKVMQDKIPGFQSLGYDPTIDKLVLTINDPSVKNSSDLISKYKIDKISGMEVELRLVLNSIAPVALMGGASLNNGAGCTAGFSAYASDRTTPGILTAYHCTDNGARKNFTLTDNVGVKHTLTLSPPTTSTTDMALYLAPAGTPIKPYYDTRDGFSPTPIYTQGKKSDLQIGSTYLCHTGITTQFSCGVVGTLNASLASTGTTMNSTGTAKLKACNTTQSACTGFVTITGPSLKCDRGDSGGPVTNSAIAYGITSSCNVEEAAKGATPVLYFSSLDRIGEVPAVLAAAPMPY